MLLSIWSVILTSGAIFGMALISLVTVKLAPKWFGKIERLASALARRRALAVASIAVLALLGRGILLLYEGVPQPVVHDEFSYLVAADTFAHGRLTNPTPPMWVHFETFHVIFQPTYASMYPPGQGIVLALGQILTGYPWVGVWLSMAAMCAAICWMLQGWMPPRWALLGGFLAVVQYALVGYWINSYWGGAVAGIGGALVFGAWPRIRRQVRVRDAVCMGVGLAILANTRPYEGLAASLPLAVAMGIWLLRKKGSSATLAWRNVVLPLAMILAMTAVGIGYYNWRVTGNPREMPYQVNLKTYYPEPMFLWQHASPFPNYRHAVMRLHYEGWLFPKYWQRRSSFVGFLESNYEYRQQFWFLLNPALVIPLFMLPWVWRGGRLRLLVVMGCVTVAAQCVEAEPFLAHYMAPVVGVLLAVVVQGMRYLRLYGRKRGDEGQILVRAVVVFSILFTAYALTPASLLGTGEGYRQHTERARIARMLDQQPGKQLVIVKNTPFHSTHNEWVYNAAEIDEAKIVWARDMGPEKNEELTRYYPSRRVWLVEPDKWPAEISPYQAYLQHADVRGDRAAKPVSTKEFGRTSVQTKNSQAQ